MFALQNRNRSGNVSGDVHVKGVLESSAEPFTGVFFIIDDEEGRVHGHAQRAAKNAESRASIGFLREQRALLRSACPTRKGIPQQPNKTANLIRRQTAKLARIKIPPFSLGSITRDGWLSVRGPTIAGGPVL